MRTRHGYVSQQGSCGRRHRGSPISGLSQQQQQRHETASRGAFDKNTGHRTASRSVSLCSLRTKIVCAGHARHAWRSSKPEMRAKAKGGTCSQKTHTRRSSLTNTEIRSTSVARAARQRGRASVQMTSMLPAWDAHLCFRAGHPSPCADRTEGQQVQALAGRVVLRNTLVPFRCVTKLIAIRNTKLGETRQT